jgi:NADH dehydrogenase [ubiquinone] 1 alpha subcomplex assembly factor 5
MNFTRRFLSSQKGNLIFNRVLKKRHREFNLNFVEDAAYYNYLREESNRRIIDRIDDISRTFPLGLEIGSHSGDLYQQINSFPSLRSEKGGVGGIEKLVQCDVVQSKHGRATSTETPLVESLFVQCDEEFLPFKPDTFDIVLSSLYFHWTNNLSDTFSSINQVLKPDGVFIASLIGNQTLKELQECFYVAESERKNGMSFHTSPFATPSDIAALMQASNFSLPAVDIDSFTISYPNAFVLMEHLFKMGEGNASLNRTISVGKDTFLSLATLYQGRKSHI